MALKVLSPDLAHKTELGGVRLGVADAAALREEAAAMRERVARAAPGAAVTGFLVQSMARGLGEAIVGFRRDPEVGPVVLLGTGGVMAELFRDVSLRPAPVDLEEAREMVGEVKGLRALAGWRGLPRGDLEALARAVVSLSRLAARDDVAEAEVNPAIIGPEGEGITVADAWVVRALNEEDTAAALLRARYGAEPDFAPPDGISPGLAAILDRRVTRRYRPEPVPEPLLRTLLAAAQSAPSKSDLQQYSIIVVQDPAKIAAVADWIGTMPWIKDAPVFLFFCGDIRRGRRLCELRGLEHANDNVDTFLNATADAALAMAHLILAAEMAGLGTCPISYVRNHVERVAPMLGLPRGVFPVAGLTLGWPAARNAPSRACRSPWWCTGNATTTAGWKRPCRPTMRCDRPPSRAIRRSTARARRAAAGARTARGSSPCRSASACAPGCGSRGISLD